MLLHCKFFWDTVYWAFMYANEYILKRERTMHIKQFIRTSLPPLLIALLFVLVCWWLIYTPPKTQRTAPVYIKPSVEVITAQPQTLPISIDATGSIIAPQKPISLRLQVSGVIKSTHESFIEGGVIPADQTIIQIASIDYALNQEEALAKVAFAKAELAIEEGKQRLAKKEFELSDNLLIDDGENKALALRKPYLEIARANLALAKLEEQKARLALSRTQLSLPFDVRVLNVASVEGEYVDSNQLVGSIIPANERWLELKFQSKHRDRLVARSQTTPGSQVSFNFNNRTYHGEIISLKADLIANTRLSGAIVKLENEQFEKQGSLFNHSIPIGTHITASVDAGSVSNVYSIPQEAYVDNQYVFILDAENRLQKRMANITWKTGQEVLVSIALNPQEKIVTSQIFGLSVGTEVTPVQRVAKMTGGVHAS